LSTVVVATVLAVAFLNPASYALGEMAQRLAETGETNLATFWRGLRQHAPRSLLMMSVGALAETMLGVSLLFYGSATLSALGVVGNYAATGWTLWVALFLGAMGVYWVPIGVGLRGTSPRVGETLKRSALLVLEAPGLAAGVLFLTVFATLFWAATGIGVFVFWMSFVRVLHAEARHVLRERSDARERLRQRGEPPTPQALRAELLRMWANQPKRRLRELLRPWDA